MRNLLFKAELVAGVHSIGVVHDNHGTSRALIEITCHDGSTRYRKFAQNNVHQLWCKAIRLVKMRQRHAQTNEAYLSDYELRQSRVAIEHASKIAKVMAKATIALTPQN